MFLVISYKRLNVREKIIEKRKKSLRFALLSFTRGIKLRDKR